MNRLLIPVVFLFALAFPLPVEAANSSIPAPQQVDGVAFGLYHPHPQVVVVGVPHASVLPCLKMGGPQTEHGRRCSLYEIVHVKWGTRLKAGGYVVITGHRWWWIDLGINIAGGHKFGWVYGPTVWAGRWASQAPSSR